MNLRQKAVKGVVGSAIQSWGRQAIAFIVFALLARLLAPEVFGLVALAGVFLAFTQVFLDQGFADGIVQREQLDPEQTYCIQLFPPVDVAYPQLCLSISQKVVISWNP